uniref:E3 ubiquitin-protein ligase hyd n=1 Tax=Cacopsylla melanoneura TaxID=428564 RepID=A0A8D8RW40_9HEMI
MHHQCLVILRYFEYTCDTLTSTNFFSCVNLTPTPTTSTSTSFFSSSSVSSSSVSSSSSSSTSSSSSPPSPSPLSKENTGAPSGQSGTNSAAAAAAAAAAVANSNATTQTSPVRQDLSGDEGLALLQDCRLMRKDELQVVRLNSTARAPECFQRVPRRISLPDSGSNILTLAVDGRGMHTILKTGSSPATSKLSYTVFNVTSARVEQECPFPLDTTAFLGLEPSNVCLTATGDGTESVLILRDGNSALFPLARDSLDAIREPPWLDLPPVRCIATGTHALSSVHSNSLKNQVSLIVLAFTHQTLLDKILACNYKAIVDTLYRLERDPNTDTIRAILAERCDANRNIIHACVTLCQPVSNKDPDTTGDVDMRDRLGDAGADPSSGMGDDPVPTLSWPPEAYDSASGDDDILSMSAGSKPSRHGAAHSKDAVSEPYERCVNAHAALSALCKSAALAPHMIELLSAKDAQGQTPFMLAVTCRAYQAAKTLFNTAAKLTIKKRPLTSSRRSSAVPPPSAQQTTVPAPVPDYELSQHAVVTGDPLDIPLPGGEATVTATSKINGTSGVDYDSSVPREEKFKFMMSSWFNNKSTPTSDTSAPSGVETKKQSSSNERTSSSWISTPGTSSSSSDAFDIAASKDKKDSDLKDGGHGPGSKDSAGGHNATSGTGVDGGKEECDDKTVAMEQMMRMIFPPGSNPDSNPLHVICCNDTCSFTWTGAEHINQDIFECRTCGLTGSLCCCTECARVCHRGHDCKLKRTSPTAYCDCWEKCKCKALVAGNQTFRFRVLDMLITETDLVTKPNSRGENILLFLVQTVGRQSIEQRQYRSRPPRASSAPQSGSSGRNKSNSGTGASGGAGGGDLELDMPEHDLEPPRFARKALDHIFRDWRGVRAMMLSGASSSTGAPSPGSTLGSPSPGIIEDEAYLKSQSGTALLDKFTHCLLVKCSNEMLERLLSTLLREMQGPRSTEATLVARRFVRSVIRIFVICSVEMAPVSGKRRSNALAAPLVKAKHVFQVLIKLGIEELVETADSLIAPVRLGVSRPTPPFTLSSSTLDVISGSEELFSVEPLASASGASSGQGASGSGGGGYHGHRAGIRSTRSGTAHDSTRVRGSSAGHGFSLNSAYGLSGAGAGDRHDFDGFGDNLTVFGMDVDSAGAGGNGSDAPLDPRLEASNGAGDISGASAQGGAGGPGAPGVDPESDDAEDLMVESESDSEGSNPDEGGGGERGGGGGGGHASHHSRGVQNSGPGGERVGGSDTEDDSSASTQLEDDESEAGDTDEGDTEEFVLNDEQLERRTTSSGGLGNRTNLAPQSMQWAIRNRDSTARSTGFRVSSGGSSLVFIDPSSLRRSANAASSSLSAAIEPVTMATTASCLARAFAIVIRQIADLLVILQDYQSGASPAGALTSEITHEDTVQLQAYLEQELRPTWDWLVTVMDSTEAQLRFGASLTNSSDPSHPSHPLYQNPSGASSSSAQSSGPGGRSSGVGGIAAATGGGVGGSGSSSHHHAHHRSSGSGSSTQNVEPRREFLSYCLSLMRAHNSEHADSLPVLDVSSLRHVAYVLDALVYYMRSGSSDMTTPSRPTPVTTEEPIIPPASNADPWSSEQDENDNEEMDEELTGDDSYGAGGEEETPPVTQAPPPVMSYVPTGGKGRKHAFFQRSDSTLCLGCPPPDPFDTPLTQALPLADQPHLLQPHARKEDLFGVPKTVHLTGEDGSSASSASVLTSLPTRLGLSCRGNSDSSRSNKPRLPEPVVLTSVLLESRGGGDDVDIPHDLSVTRGSSPPPNSNNMDMDIDDECTNSSLPATTNPGPTLTSSNTTNTSDNSTAAAYDRGIIVSAVRSSTGVIVRAGSGASTTPNNNNNNNNSSSNNSSSSSSSSSNNHHSHLFSSSKSQESKSIPNESGGTGSGSTSGAPAGTTNNTKSNNNSSSSTTNKPHNNSSSSSNSIQMEQENNSTSDTLLDENQQQTTGTQTSSKPNNTQSLIGQAVSHELLLGRWRLSLDLFGRVFMEDVGLEPGSIVSDLGGFPVKEAKFRREMEKLRNVQSRDLTLSKMERDRTALITATFKELNAQYQAHHRRGGSTPPLVFARVKVTFKDEPGEGSGVARSFYTAIAEALLSNEPLPNLECTLAGGSGSSVANTSGTGGATGGSSSSSRYASQYGGVLQRFRDRDIVPRYIRLRSPSLTSANANSSSSSGSRTREPRRQLSISARPFTPIGERGENGSGGGGGGGGEGKGRDAEVRELMEKLVESLVEEDLDQTPITPVTTHPSYKSIPRLESTETVQAQLKSLIVQVLREANSLPNIQLNAAHPKSGNPENLKSKSYEDILATTILNKIVEKSQLTKQEATPSEASSTEGRRNSQTKKSIKATCEFKLGPDGRSRQTLFTSTSADGGDVEEVNGWTGGGRTSLLCTTVEHIEEVITRYSPNEYEAEESECTSSLKPTNQSEVSKTLSGVQYSEGVHHRAPCPELGRDIVDGSALLEENRFNSDEEFNIGIEFINDLETWQENWLFQKKKLSRSHSARSSVHHPVPVPMLVPCPGPDQTCRTLIGDVDAEETSDLSECSDSMYDDPIFKTSSPKAASSKPRSSSKSRRSSSLKVVGSSSSEEDEDNTEDRWIEARNKELLLSTSPVDSGEGSLEMLTEEESSLPLSNTGRDNKPVRPVPKPRKSATKSNSKVDLKMNNSEPNTITNGTRPNNTISNEPPGSKNGRCKTKTTTQTFLENERNAPSNGKTEQEIKTNGVIPNKTKHLPEDLTKDDGTQRNSKSKLTQTSKHNRNGDSKPNSDSEVRKNATNQRTNDTMDEKHNDLNIKHKDTNEEVIDSKEINNNTNKQPSKTSETDIQNNEKHTNRTLPDGQIDRTTKTEVKDLNKSTNTKNNTKGDQNTTRNHTQKVYHNKEVVKPEETDDKHNEKDCDPKSTVHKKDNTKCYSKDIVDESKQVEPENIPKSIKKEENVPEQIGEKYSNGDTHTNINADKCNNTNGEIERRNSKETNGIVNQSNKDINGAFNQSANEGANQSTNGLIEEEPIAKESYDREQEAEMREIEILNTPPKPGTIAEREHAKWLSAVPMENNPYSKENIEKRNRQKLFDISRSTSSDQTESNEETDHSRSESIIVTSSSSPDLIKRYSRDYYINNSLGNTPSHISTSNTSLSSLGGGKPVAHPIKLMASSTPSSRPQPKQRSKELDDLKRPANVSSDEDESFLGEHDVNMDVNTDEKIKHAVETIETNVEMENVEQQNTVGRHEEMENKHEQFEHSVVTDAISQSDANDIRINDNGIKDKTDTERIGKESKSEKAKQVDKIDTTNGNKNNQSEVTKNDNTEKDEISDSNAKNSYRGIERSASQAEFQKMPVQKTDPKYASVQTLPNMNTNEKPKKKKKSLFSSIRNFLTNKKAKSISKCESSKTLLFADKSLQNIYSDTWNQKQADQMKRESFDDELLETFRKSKIKQIENFILNEQAVKGSEENNFDYLKNMNEEHDKETGNVDENTPNLDSRNEEKSELNKTAPLPLNISSDILEMQCDKEARIIISTAVKEVTVLDNHFEANDQRRIDDRRSSGNEEKPSILNAIPIISITDTEEVLTIETRTPKGVHNSNASTLERQHNVKSTSETDKTSPNTNTKNVFDSIETITPNESNKSNTSTLERQRNANSVPIQVVHEQTEHPCGDIIVHVDSDQAVEDIQNNDDAFEEDIDYEETFKNHDTQYKEILDISEDTRLHFIKEIDKIFEQEGLNITFEHDTTTHSLNETCEECNDSNKPNETNVSPKTTLDKSLLKAKKEEIHAKIIKRHLMACKGQTKDTNNGNVYVNDENNDLDNNMDSAEHSIALNNELNDIKDKIAEKFDVQNITMQKTIHVSTALQSDNVEDLENDHEADSSIENSIPGDMNLEEYVLRNSLRHKVLKPKTSVATANFSVNPLYSNDEDGEKPTTENLNDSTDHQNRQETAENGERSTSLESNANDSFLSDEFSFHARKTPESGYSSNVEIFSRINTPELMEGIPETTRGINELGSREDLESIECQIPRMENVDTDKLYKKTVQRQILSEFDSFEKENEHTEVNENASKGNNVEGNNLNSGGIADERLFVNDIDTFIRNEQTHSHNNMVKPASEECAIHTNVESILNEDLLKLNVSTDNSQLLEPGILLDNRIIRERRNVILNTTTAKPDESEKTHIDVQKSQTETLKEKTETHKAQTVTHKTQTEAPKSLVEAKNLVPDLNEELSAEFDKLQRVFSRSLEHLDEIESDKSDACNKRNVTENPVENKNPNINESCNSDENRSEKADDSNETIDNLKQLCDGRNILNFNTRL